MWMVLVWQIVTICQMAKLPPAKLFRYMVAHTESGAGCSWDFNYPALVSLINGQYYMEYHAYSHDGHTSDVESHMEQGYWMVRQ